MGNAWKIYQLQQIQDWIDTIGLFKYMLKYPWAIDGWKNIIAMLNRYNFLCIA